MRAAKRLKRIREVEKTVARLLKAGWKLECVEHIDEAGEPLRTVITLTCDGRKIRKGIL